MMYLTSADRMKLQGDQLTTMQNAVAKKNSNFRRDMYVS